MSEAALPCAQASPPPVPDRGGRSKRPRVACVEPRLWRPTAEQQPRRRSGGYGASGTIEGHGLLGLLEGADLRTTAHAQKLLTEHEMGELFKVIGLARGCDASFTTAPIGFAQGDRTHTL